MAEQNLSPEAIQQLAIDIANDVAQRISEVLGDLSKTAPMGCNPGPFDCPREFACSTFAALVTEPPAKVARRRP